MVIAWLCYDMKYNLISLLIDISCSDITTCKVQRNHFQWHFINWSRRTLHGDEGPSHIQNIDESAILPFYWKLRYHNYSLSHSIDSSSFGPFSIPLPRFTARSGKITLKRDVIMIIISQKIEGIWNEKAAFPLLYHEIFLYTYNLKRRI